MHDAAPHDVAYPDFSRGTGHVVLGDIVVFAGQPTPSLVGAGSTGPRVVLVHNTGNATGAGGGAYGRIGESRLLSADTSDAWTLGCVRPVVGVAVPVRRLVTPPLAESSVLAPTSLVQISRAMLLDLVAAPAGDNSGTGPLEDVLIALLQGILRENPDVVAGSRREGLAAADVTAIIDARHADPHFDVATMALELHVSRRQLYRYAPAGTGLAGLLAARRLRTAVGLLQEHPHLTLTTVAQLSGFRDAATMRVQFLRRLGKTPRAFRDRDV